MTVCPWGQRSCRQVWGVPALQTPGSIPPLLRGSRGGWGPWCPLGRGWVGGCSLGVFAAPPSPVAPAEPPGSLSGKFTAPALPQLPAAGSFGLALLPLRVRWGLVAALIPSCAAAAAEVVPSHKFRGQPRSCPSRCAQGTATGHRSPQTRAPGPQEGATTVSLLPGLSGSPSQLPTTAALRHLLLWGARTAPVLELLGESPGLPGGERPKMGLSWISPTAPPAPRLCRGSHGGDSPNPPRLPRAGLTAQGCALPTSLVLGSAWDPPNREAPASCGVAPRSRPVPWLCPARSLASAGRSWMGLAEAS